MTEYRAHLWDYLKNGMNAIAPNLTILVGELVVTRLISHAGSLVNLAKQPASTVQIIGAEKALFRALKTKHDTPKYGCIFHASLVGQAAPESKGKISRVLAAKASHAIRVDALSDDVTPDTTIGFEGRSKLEACLQQLEGGTAIVTNGTSGAGKTAKYDAVAAKTVAMAPSYNDASDMVLESPDKKEKKKKEKSSEKKKKKRKAEDEVEEDADEDDEAAKKSAKTAKKEKKKSRKSSD